MNETSLKNEAFLVCGQIKRSISQLAVYGTHLIKNKDQLCLFFDNLDAFENQIESFCQQLGEIVENKN